MLRDLVQEVRELGWRGTAFRASWELRQRTAVAARLARRPPPLDPAISLGRWTARLPFADPVAVAQAMADRIPGDNLARLGTLAAEAVKGRIQCFGRWTADYGNPIDWHLNPDNRERWNPEAPWSLALADEPRVGDVKLTWEVARFPHAYHMARAAAFEPGLGAELAAALVAQFEHFTSQNPYGRGVHWASGQETAFRLLAWLFALDALLVRSEHGPRSSALVADALAIGAEHIDRNIDYARLAVYNNHLLSEALILYGVGVLLPELPAAARWRRLGHRILTVEASRQFYEDGAYIQQSHNYHRVALHTLLWASLFARSGGDKPAEAWLSAMDRSLGFLFAHQNPEDGRLPNYGANDGALPSLFSTCDFSDFRPALQAVSVAVRGERLYEPGPWDETTAWLFGPAALDLPLRKPGRRSVSFAPTGYHLLRGAGEASFAAFRCGTIRDRFSQIDMLHLDVWWRGVNVLVDGGSYLYNGPAEWHEHFLRTGCHNTVAVDGRDQMLHFRRFKNLYWTKARLLEFGDSTGHAFCSGEHFGYARHPGGCVHRRSVLFVKDDLWVVVDQVRGEGTHRVGLQWLAGELPYAYSACDGRLSLETTQGPFSVAVFDDEGRPALGTVLAGAEHPPRGWVSRYYGERRPAPSLVVERTAKVPITLVTVLGAGEPMLELDGGVFSVTQQARVVRFRVRDGMILLSKTQNSSGP
ncbi:MAG: heparinase II/III family protein [Myxococcaceae bacterium]